MSARQLIACMFLTVWLPYVALGDDAEIKKVARKKADEAQSALIKGDYGVFADQTHPKVVEMLGGKEKMVDGLVKQMSSMKEKGYAFKSVKMHDASDPVYVGKDIYILVPFTMEISAPNGRGASKSSLIGFSKDDGKSWVFVDAVPGREKLKRVLPDLPDSLVIPKTEPPTFVKD